VSLKLGMEKMELAARRLTPTRLSLPHTTRKSPATDPRLTLVLYRKRASTKVAYLNTAIRRAFDKAV